MSSLAQTAYFVQLAAIPVGAAFIFRFARHATSAQWPSIFLATGCAALALLTFRISDPYYFSWDFHAAYYAAGKAVMASARQLRDLTGLGVNGFVNMPVIAYIFAPFALLPERWAMNLFLVFGVAAIAVSWLTLTRVAKLETTDRWLLLLLFAGNGPLLYSLKIGNSSQFILLALVGALAFLRAGRAATGGGLLAAAAMIKPPLLLFGLFFLLRRDLRGTIGFGAICAGTILLSLALFGWDDNWHWFEVCIVQFSHRWLVAYNVQSIPAFLFRPLVPASLLGDWNSSLPPAGLITPVKILFALLFALAAAALWRRSRAPMAQASLPTLELQYCLVICLVILSSPLSWSHYYCWLLLPAALFLGWRRELPRLARICGWLAILLVTPVVRLLKFDTPWLLEAYKNVGVSHLLFGAMLWFGLIVWWLARPFSPHGRKP